MRWKMLPFMVHLIFVGQRFRWGESSGLVQFSEARPNPVTASTAWHLVVVRRRERDIEDLEAKAFIEQFMRLLLASGAPDEAKVFRVNSDGGHAYLLSPRASEIARRILQAYGASALDSAPQAGWLAELNQLHL